MFHLIIAIISIAMVSSLAMVATFYGAAAFTSTTSAVANGRKVKPFMVSKSCKTPVGLQVTLALLLASLVALGFVAIQ